MSNKNSNSIKHEFGSSVYENSTKPFNVAHQYNEYNIHKDPYNRDYTGGKSKAAVAFELNKDEKKSKQDVKDTSKEVVNEQVKTSSTSTATKTATQANTVSSLRSVTGAIATTSVGVAAAVVGVGVIAPVATPKVEHNTAIIERYEVSSTEYDFTISVDNKVECPVFMTMTNAFGTEVFTIELEEEITTGRVEELKPASTYSIKIYEIQDDKEYVITKTTCTTYSQ